MIKNPVLVFLRQHTDSEASSNRVLTSISWHTQICVLETAARRFEYDMMLLVESDARQGHIKSLVTMMPPARICDERMATVCEKYELFQRKEVYLNF